MKRGLAWGGGDANITQYEKNNNVGWFYTWNTQNWVRDSNTLEFVPMLWGAKQIADFPATVNQTSVASGVVKHILGMNELSEYNMTCTVALNAFHFRLQT